MPAEVELVVMDKDWRSGDDVVGRATFTITETGAGAQSRLALATRGGTISVSYVVGGVSCLITKDFLSSYLPLSLSPSLLFYIPLHPDS